MQHLIERPFGKPLIRQQIGDYLLLDHLGEGGMGSVFLARQMKTGRMSALKIVSPHLASLSNFAQRFEIEARAIMRIAHPNVIHLEAYGRLNDGTLYHVLELLEGEDLRRVMERRGRFATVEALPYIHQICMGLQAAHDRQVVHRDLKPENIFVLYGQPPTVKLLDFGISKLLDPGQWMELTATGVILGSPLFMAPEQARGDGQSIGPHTDIYSLGVVMYMMLGGAPPFDSRDAASLVHDQMMLAPRPLRFRAPAVSEPVARLVHRCLAKDPADRPGSAALVAMEFEQLVALEGPTCGEIPDDLGTQIMRMRSAPIPIMMEHDTVVDVDVLPTVLPSLEPPAVGWPTVVLSPEQVGTGEGTPLADDLSSNDHLELPQLLRPSRRARREPVVVAALALGVVLLLALVAAATWVLSS